MVLTLSLSLSAKIASFAHLTVPSRGWRFFKTLTCIVSFVARRLLQRQVLWKYYKCSFLLGEDKNRGLTPRNVRDRINLPGLFFVQIAAAVYILIELYFCSSCTATWPSASDLQLVMQKAQFLWSASSSLDCSCQALSQSSHRPTAGWACQMQPCLGFNRARSC